MYISPFSSITLSCLPKKHWQKSLTAIGFLKGIGTRHSIQGNKGFLPHSSMVSLAN
jgi:hypothetical protein